MREVSSIYRCGNGTKLTNVMHKSLERLFFEKRGVPILKVSAQNT